MSRYKRHNHTLLVNRPNPSCRIPAMTHFPDITCHHSTCANQSMLRSYFHTHVGNVTPSSNMVSIYSPFLLCKHSDSNHWSDTGGPKKTLLPALTPGKLTCLNLAMIAQNGTAITRFDIAFLTICAPEQITVVPISLSANNSSGVYS